VQANERQQYAAPTAYWTGNATDVGELRARVAKAEAELRHARARSAPSSQLAKLEGALRSLKAELDAAEQPKRDQRKREGGTGSDDAPPTTRNTQQPRKACRCQGDKVAAFYAAQGKKAEVVQGMYGPAIMVR
jgi:hypothetical protein